jgi:hypothetical protein
MEEGEGIKMDAITMEFIVVLVGFILLILGSGLLLTQEEEGITAFGAILFGAGFLMVLGGLGAVFITNATQNTSETPQTVTITDKFTNGGYFYITDEYGTSYSLSSQNPADTWHKLQTGKTYSANKYTSSISITSTTPVCETPIPTCVPTPVPCSRC